MLRFAACQGRGWAAPALALACMVAAGCGGKSGEIPAVPAAGTVTIKGKPVANGTIQLVPDNGRPATGPIKDGKFTVSTYTEGDGAVAGKHKVALFVVEEFKGKDGDTYQKSLIPDKYSQPDNSGIEVEVPAGGNTNIQIDIK